MPFSQRLTRLVLAALLLTNCQRGQQDSEQNPNSAATDVTAPSTETLAREFGPMLRGVWVKEDYLAELARTRSPLLAAPALLGIAALRIDPAERTGDSLRVGVNLNNHEGDELMLYFRPGAEERALPTNRPDYERPGSYHELAYDPAPADTTLLLHLYAKGGRRLATTRYRRLQRRPQPGGAQYEVITKLVNRQLLAGTYAATDSAGRRAQVRLSPDGAVRGLGRFRTYQPATDFVVTVANNLDYVILDPETPRRRLLAFVSSLDTLRLYAVQLEEPELAEPYLRRGRLHYTLVRQRKAAPQP